MSRSETLRQNTQPLWERVVTHPFIQQLGDNALPQANWDAYFEQDYLFLRDWAILLSLATAKAPDFDAARQLVGFLHLGLGGEEGLFQEAFRQRGLSREQVAQLTYRPTTRHYSAYLRQQAYEGGFLDVVATLLAMEWPYLEWAERLAAAGKRPANHYYQTWIDLHISEGMRGFVRWMRQTIDVASASSADVARWQGIFRDVTRHELAFFNMALALEEWPQQ